MDFPAEHEKNVFGQFDEYVKKIERALNVTIISRDGKLKILGIEVSANQASLGLWQTIISKYHPTFLTACENAVAWSAQLAEQWLKEVNPQIDFDKIKNVFLNHNKSYSHSRHLSKQDCKNAGLNIVDLETNPDLQDAILSLHHCYMILFDKFLISKVVENNIGGRYMQNYNAK